MIAAKRIYDPPSDSEGMRVLIMRLWPRGIRKTRVDVWLNAIRIDAELHRDEASRNQASALL